MPASNIVEWDRRRKALEQIRVLRDLVNEVHLPDAPCTLLLSNLEELTAYTKRLNDIAMALKEDVRGDV